MPPEPYEYQGLAAIAAFLRHRAALRGAPLRLISPRANTQPAFGCYLPCAQTPISRPYGMIVLTLRGDQISTITWFSCSSIFPTLGSPAHCPNSAGFGQIRQAPAASCGFPLINLARGAGHADYLFAVTDHQRADDPSRPWQHGSRGSAKRP
jgi:hypothetical protein